MLAWKIDVELVMMMLIHSFIHSPRRRLGIEGVVEVTRRGRVRWFGHVERKEVDDWVSACRNLEVAGSRGRGRPRMTWRLESAVG